MYSHHLKGYSKSGILTVATVFIVIITIFTTAFIVLDRIKSTTQFNLESNLRTTLKATQNAFKHWQTVQQKLVAHTLKSSPQLTQAIEAQLALHKIEGKLNNSSFLTEIRTELEPLIQKMNYQGFFVIAPDLINIASRRDVNIGWANLLAKEGNFLQRVFEGETLFSQPVLSDVPLPNIQGQLVMGQASMFAAFPVYNSTGKVIAIVTFRIAPTQELERILAIGISSKTGETYFFNRQAQLISRSRFENQLREFGFLGANESSILNIELRDPGGNMTQGFKPTKPYNELPLTHMAKEALAGRSGINLEGYRDYRGIEVVGVWKTPQGINTMGIATEIDKSEAYAVLITTRNLLLAALVITITLLLILATTLAGGRERAIRLAQQMTKKLHQSEHHYKQLANLSHMMSRASSIDSIVIVAVQEIRRIFQVDRVWLAYPSDQNTTIWHVHTESAKPSCFRSLSNEIDIPQESELASLIQETLKTTNPVSCDFPIDNKSSRCSYDCIRQFHICTAIRPKVNQPWILGLCQCSSERQWSDSEKSLLQEIADLLTHHFTNLLLLDGLDNAFTEHKNIMDTVPDVIITVSPDNRLSDWNNSLELVTGLLPDELDGKPVLSLICPEDRPLVDQAIKECFKKGFVEIEARLTQKNGNLVPFYWVAASRKDQNGNIISLSGAGRDITEHKIAEEALLKSEARLAEAQRIAKLGNWEWNISDNSLYWSQQVYEIFDVPPDGLTTYEAFIEHIHPDDQATIKAAINKALAGSAPYNIDHRVVRNDGSIRIVQEQGEVAFDSNNQPIRMVGTVQDITQRKLAAEELRRHRDHLQELVKEQTANLMTAKEAAEKANHAKSEFLANMSHELRTPMHSILSFAEIGKEKIDVAPKEKLHRYFSCIQDSGQRLLGLLNDLLDLSKLEAGHMEFSMNKHNIRDVVEAAHMELSTLLKNKSITLQETPSNIDTEAWIDFDKLLQVMLNLLSNAIKFTPEGSTIQIHYRNSELPIGRRAADSNTVPAISITVEDEGIGIPQEELGMIFEKFIQSSKTDTGAGGTGLGLAICKEIITGHGGTIRAKNTPNGGAAFTFVIPRTQEREKSFGHKKSALVT